MTTLKQERMAERIREILSTLLLTEINDPALQEVTVTEVRLDRELEYATIYVNALGDEDSRGEVMAGLRRAVGFLRREVGKRVQLRRVPELRFVWDESLSRADGIEKLLDSLKSSTASSATAEKDVTPDE
ncbi:MAG: 30S ribosome-binding factor RbfA [Anaerolinea sp.]|nr:30S ribosome-binding factor RbfA [Anaerolinea sp.]MCC6976136.1 30S ribosome-binding factor RbfA [Anaerolineae bacterium]CAG0953173.1 Ribosome-binding factor A [Anaerolineae bacterium]